MTMQSVERLFALIDSFGDEVSSVGSVPMEGIDKVEDVLGVRFPEEYRAFLSRYGAITIGQVRVYGISYPVDSEPSIVWALRGLWEVFPEMPRSLIPIRDLAESGAVACIECQSAESKSSEAPVVLWKFDPQEDEQNPVFLSEGFAAYLSETLTEFKHRRAALSILEQHVAKFETDYLSQGKLPRNHIWRPFRFCSQDVVLGLAVVRHSIDNNCLEVDVCLTSDVPEYEPGSGAKWMASFLLSEAYKCGGSMEIRFSTNVEDGHVPRALCDLCDAYGVVLEHAADGRITPLEARSLYVALTDFSPALRDEIQGLARVARLSEERACYAVHHGLWTRAELETIVLGAPRGDSILGGDAQPEQRHLYQSDLAHARASVMGGLLDRKLAKRLRGDADEALDLEDDVRPLEVAFDPTYYAKVYCSTEQMPVPWVVGQSQDTAGLPAGVQLIALLRARETEDLTVHLQQDLDLAAECLASLQGQGTAARVSVLVPRDFDNLSQRSRDEFADKAHALNVDIMVCPDTTVSLDADAARRLSSSRIMRE